MAKKMRQQITWSSYQKKGFDCYAQIRELSALVGSDIFKEIERSAQIQQELEQWKKESKERGKKVDSAAVSRKTAELQDSHYQDFTGHQKVVEILKQDYNDQNFNGRGKKLLIIEIAELAQIIKPVSLSKENRANKRLLNTMKSIVNGWEELEQMQKALRDRATESTKESTKESKEKTSILSIFMKRKTKSDHTENEQEPEVSKKQKTSKNDMFAQRERQFKTGEPSLVSKEDEAISKTEEEMDEPKRAPISLY